MSLLTCLRKPSTGWRAGVDASGYVNRNPHDVVGYLMTDVAMPTTLAEDPAAALFPLLDGEELVALVESVRKDGLLHPIVLTPEGTVLDGRNRLRACEEAGVEPRYETYQGDDRVGYVVRANITRRHLTPGQKAALASAARPLFAAEAAKRVGGRPRKGTKPPQNLGEVSDRHAGEAIVQAAKAFGVSAEYVRLYELAAKEAPDLAADVRSGELTPHRADSIRRVRIRQAQERRDQVAQRVTTPRITHNDGLELLASLKGEADLVFTDPPFSTHGPGIAAFASSWMPLAQEALKPSGRFYAFVGSYPAELHAYLTELASWGWEHQVLTWHYPDTIGTYTTHHYKIGNCSGPSRQPDLSFEQLA